MPNSVRRRRVAAPAPICPPTRIAPPPAVAHRRPPGDAPPPGLPTRPCPGPRPAGGRALRGRRLGGARPAGRGRMWPHSGAALREWRSARAAGRTRRGAQHEPPHRRAAGRRRTSFGYWRGSTCSGTSPQPRRLVHLSQRQPGNRMPDRAASCADRLGWSVCMSICFSALAADLAVCASSFPRKRRG